MSLRGFATINFSADNVPAAVAWYAEFRPGDYENEPITPRGDSGFVTASVVDPFGDLLGVMSDPHYVEIASAGRH